MITDQCQLLADRVAGLAVLRQNVDQVTRFQKFRDLVAAHAGVAAEWLAVWRTLRGGGIGVADCAADAAALAARVGGVLDAFRARHESVIEPAGFSAVEFGKSLGGLTKRLEDRLTASWQTYAGGRIAPPDPAVLAVLDPAFPGVVRRIRDCSERLERSLLAPPASAGQLADFHAQLDALQEAWGQLDGGHIPAEVLDFLRATATPTGAGLGLLTDGVRAWLTSKGILASFCVGAIKAPGVRP